MIAGSIALQEDVLADEGLATQESLSENSELPWTHQFGAAVKRAFLGRRDAELGEGLRVGLGSRANVLGVLLALDAKAL